jgi:hypothetical protein
MMQLQPNQFALARMSRGSKVITGLALSLGVGLLVASVGVAVTSPRRVWIPLVAAGLVWLVFLNVWGFHRPKYFEVAVEGLRIVWPFRRRLLPPTDIAAVRLVTSDEAGLPVRLIGAGGFFGTFGLCRSAPLGLFRAYVSDRKKLVLIDRRGFRPLLISPDRPETFVQALRDTLGVGG